MFALSTGMRLSEILNMRWQDIHDNRINVTSQKTFKTKSKRNRVVPVNQTALDVLTRRKAVSNSEYVFCTEYGTQIDKMDMIHRFQRLVKRLKITGNYPDMSVSTHTLRHTFATKLCNQKQVSVMIVSNLLGHSDIRVTQKYVSVADEHLHDAVAKLD